MDGHLLTTWTIRISLLCYATVLAAQLKGQQSDKSRDLRRWIWTAGCLFFLAHVVCAFHFHHDWSHSKAVQHIADVTEDKLGWAFGGGVYFNYLFGLLWVADAGWMWVSFPSYENRSRGARVGFHVYMMFIAINGTIFFESGPIRWVGTAVCGVLLLLLVMRIREKKKVWPIRR